MKGSRFISFLIFSVLLISIGVAEATSGRLNKDGCHNSKKVGYHCHRAQSGSKSVEVTPSLEPESAAAPTPKVPPKVESQATEPLKKSRVTRVVDGDTFELENGEKVRLICIDTPESNEKWYLEAGNFARSIVLGKTVYLEKDVTDRDKYGRLLRYLRFTPNLADKTINEEIVAAGWADAYVYQPDVKYCDKMIDAQGLASSTKKGYWGKGGSPKSKNTTPTKTKISQEKQSTNSVRDSSCVLLGCPEGTVNVGSRNSNVYHRCICRYAKQIKPPNLRCFNSTKSAELSGYRPAQQC